MGSQMDIKNRLFLIIEKTLSVDQSAIKLESLIGEDLGADSLDTAELAMAIKEEFDRDLTDEQIAGIKTVQDLVTILELSQKGEIK
jgi:acyl carrier protein